MSSRVVAERYARALFDAALEQKLVEAVADDLSALMQALTHSPELERFFFHRQLTPVKKQTMLMPVLERVLEKQITRNFILLLWQKKREAELASIVAAYQSALRQSRGELVAEVTATRQLSASELEQLGQQVKAMTGCQNVELQTQIDTSLLGGVVLRIGDKVYDGSLARRLQQLRQKILQAQVHQSGVSS
jgi:F-type H+-transporting ATPase subunit delta